MPTMENATMIFAAALAATTAFGGAERPIPDANLSNATEPGVDCDRKPYVWPLMVLGN